MNIDNLHKTRKDFKSDKEYIRAIQELCLPPQHLEIIDLKKEIERLNNLIKEAIDYIEYYLAKGKTKNHRKFDTSVLDILKGVDKE